MVSPGTAVVLLPDGPGWKGGRTACVLSEAAFLVALPLYNGSASAVVRRQSSKSADIRCSRQVSPRTCRGQQPQRCWRCRAHSAQRPTVHRWPSTTEARRQSYAEVGGVTIHDHARAVRADPGATQAPVQEIKAPLKELGRHPPTARLMVCKKGRSGPLRHRRRSQRFAAHRRLRGDEPPER